jgi:hypothetical protein
LLTKSREFLKVDLRRSDKTAYEHTYYIKKFLNELPKPVELATVEDVREYLKNLKGISSAQYKNILMRARKMNNSDERITRAALAHLDPCLICVLRKMYS